MEKIEVKYCFNINHYHSFFIELLANKEKGEPGWIDYTKSDFIFYVDAISNDCHIIRPFDIRNYLATHDYQTRECHKDKYKTSVGAIVPLEAFSKEYYIKTINLKKYAAWYPLKLYSIWESEKQGKMMYHKLEKIFWYIYQKWYWLLIDFMIYFNRSKEPRRKDGRHNGKD